MHPTQSFAARDIPDGRRGGGSQGGATATASERDALYTQIKDTLSGDGVHDEEVQYELSRWVELLETSKEDLHEGKRSKDDILERLVREAGAAIPALLSANPELVFARSLRVQAENKLLRHNGLFKRVLIRVTDGSPLLIVGLGVFLALLLGPAVHLLWQAVQGFGAIGALIPFNPGHTSAVAAAAFLGGLVSILSRLSSFSRLGDFDHAFLFFNALSKPFVGVVFGLFAYALWQGDLLPLDEQFETATLEGLWAVGFLAGFSERFTKDLISRGEGLFSTPKK